MLRLASLVVTFFILAFSSASAATFYVDAVHGNDTNTGTSQSRPWRTLPRVTRQVLHPGDRLLFRSRDTWIGQLAISSSGTASKPILVGKYGAGPRPHLDGAGQ